MAHGNLHSRRIWFPKLVRAWEAWPLMGRVVCCGWRAVPLRLDHAPIALTPDYGGSMVRYADGVVDLHSGRYVTVREDHRQSGTEPTTTIVSVELSGNDIKEPNILVSGNDFYAFPRLTRDGGRIAWIEWSHPNMPWDKAELWVGYLSEDGKVGKRVCIAGYDLNMIESPTEPKWSSEGELFFITDRKSGFWNLYKWDLASKLA